MLSLIVIVFALLPHAAFAAPSIDGSTTGTWSGTGDGSGGSTSGTVTLTTTDPKDIIVVGVFNETGTANGLRTVSSVTAPGLTFVQRSVTTAASFGESGANQGLEVWWAVASSPLSSEVITVTLSGAPDDASIVAFGVNGANTSTPWDANASLGTASAEQSAGALSPPTTNTFSTNNANDILLAFAGTSANETWTGGGSDTLLANSTNTGGTDFSALGVEYQVVSAIQTNVTESFDDTDVPFVFLISDAIQAASPPSGRIIRLRGGLRLIGGVRLGGTSPVPRQTFATLSIDGTPNTNTATGASTITVPLTTSLTNDIIVVDVHNEVLLSSGASVAVQSVTAPGLTFAERSSFSGEGVSEYDDLERWWALATSTFSGTITVTFNSPIDDASVVAYGVHGANTSSPWDADGPFTYYQLADPSGPITPTISSVSTAAANTMLLAAASNGDTDGGGDQTAGSGYTLIGTTFTEAGANSSSIGSEYQVFSSPQSNITVPFGSTYDKDFEMIVDAIQAAP